jgi:sugar/nucleoside kinase (ribokinase family)
VRPLALVGSLSLDRVDGSAPRIGGGAYHGARALRLLSRPGRVVARCGDRDRAALLPQLAALGAPVTMLEAERTHGFSLRYEDEGRRMEVEEVGDPWRPEQVAGLPLQRCGTVHVAPLLRSDFPPETLATLARGRRLSLDGQGLVRRPQTGPLALDADVDPRMLEHVHVLKLAEEEARVLLGRVDASSLAGLGVPEVVVTLGMRGSLVYAGGRLERVEAHPLRRVDPTGAGDAFAVAYLAGRSDGHAPAASARRASALVAGLLGGRVR